MINQTKKDNNEQSYFTSEPRSIGMSVSYLEYLPLFRNSSFIEESFYFVANRQNIVTMWYKKMIKNAKSNVTHSTNNIVRFLFYPLCKI